MKPPPNLWPLIAILILGGGVLLFMLSVGADRTPSAARTAHGAWESVGRKATKLQGRATSAALTRTSRQAESEPQTGLAGTVWSNSKSRLSNATVCVLPTDGVCCSPSDCVLTAEDGSFVFASLGRQRPVLVASASGHATTQVDLDRTADKNRIDLDLLPETDGSHYLTGRVLDALGGVLGGALVSARGKSSEGRATATHSDETGVFQLSLSAGPYDLQAMATSYSSATRWVRVPTGALVVQLSPAGAIVGKLIGEQEGERFAGARIYLASQGGVQSVTRTTSAASDGPGGRVSSPRRTA